MPAISISNGIFSSRASGEAEQESGSLNVTATGGDVWTSPYTGLVLIECYGAGTCGGLAEINGGPGGASGAYSRAEIDTVAGTIYDLYVGAGEVSGEPDHNGDTTVTQTSGTVLVCKAAGALATTNPGLVDGCVGDYAESGTAGQTPLDGNGGNGANAPGPAGGIGGAGQITFSSIAENGQQPGAGGGGQDATDFGTPGSGGHGRIIITWPAP